MQLDYTVAPSDLLWAKDLFTYVQAFKAGTLDTSAAFEQFGWIILPEITAHGVGGPFTAYFAIKAGTDASPFNVLNPLTNIAIWTVKHNEPSVSILQATNVGLLLSDVFAATSAGGLEKLIFRHDDQISFTTPTTDHSNDVLHGWDGNDTIEVHGSGGNDTVLGDDEGDHIYGGCGHDSLAGFDGDDTVSGGAGNDSVQGGTGNDSLTGDSGDDVLYGSVGTDTLAGGTGADLFVFTCGGAVDHYDSGLTPSQRDVVADFTPGDDLIRLVESTLAPIKLIGSADFTGENQVRWVSKGGSTTLYINGDSDLAADMAIVLTGVTPLNAVVFQLA